MASSAERERIRRSKRAHRESSKEDGRLALCLSGGGFRAALFHLGALRRLHEAGVLEHIDTISSVSGGSILAAHLVERVRDWDTLRDMPWNERSAWWEEEVAKSFREFTSHDIRTGAIARRLLPWNWLRTSLSVEILEASLSRLTELTIAELPDRPEYIFCATDLATGDIWESKKLRRTSLGVTSDSEAPLGWPVARAVAASSCFPPVFGPLRVHQRGSKGTQQPEHMKKFLSETAHAQGVSLDSPGSAEITVFGMFRDMFSEDSGMRILMDNAIRRAHLAKDHHLSDGGLSDNLGLMSVWDTHENGRILVSNGGSTLNPDWRESWLWRVMRYTNVMDQHGRRAIWRLLRQSFENKIREGAYWDITGVINFGSKKDLEPSYYEPGYTRKFADERIAKIRTDLNAFSDAEQKILENHGYMMAEMVIAQLGTELVNVKTPPPAWPHPDFADESLARSRILDQGHIARLMSNYTQWLPGRLRSWPRRRRN